MTFVYLILTHKNPAQLLSLIKALGSKGSYFLVHIDALSDIGWYKHVFKGHAISNLFFCPFRKPVLWGGFGMVEATVSLINYIFQIGLKADYVHLISGQDYPLKSNKEISEFFRLNYGQNYLEHFTLPYLGWQHQGMDRIQYKYGMNLDMEWWYNDLQYPGEARKTHLPDNIIPYGGWQWWSLHFDCIQFLKDECNNNNPLYRFYRYTFISDEMFFHTLIMNSPFKETVVNNNLRYVDWSEKRHHPKTFKKQDIEALIKSGKLFARKFDELVDSEILSLIEEQRNKPQISCNGK